MLRRGELLLKKLSAENISHVPHSKNQYTLLSILIPGRKTLVPKVTQSLALIGGLAAAMGTSLAPCCFPLLGFLPALAGWAGWTAGSPWITQGSTLAALTGLWLARRRFGGILSLICGLSGAGLIFVAYHIAFYAFLVYGGLVLLVAAALGPWAYRFAMRLLRRPILRSVLTCPSCGFRRAERMPTNACLFFWDCPRCGARARPLLGDCCVFCSYGSVPCPPVQFGGCACL
jgi:hypothetical protein